jgi:hypothetical protein
MNETTIPFDLTHTQFFEKLAPTYKSIRLYHVYVNPSDNQPFLIRQRQICTLVCIVERRWQTSGGLAAKLAAKAAGNKVAVAAHSAAAALPSPL